MAEVSAGLALAAAAVSGFSAAGNLVLANRANVAVHTYVDRGNQDLNLAINPDNSHKQVVHDVREANLAFAEASTGESSVQTHSWECAISGIATIAFAGGGLANYRRRQFY